MTNQIDTKQNIYLNIVKHDLYEVANKFTLLGLGIYCYIDACGPQTYEELSFKTVTQSDLKFTIQRMLDSLVLVEVTHE